MKFPLLVLLAAGALSAPRFEFNDLQEYVGATESKCDNLRRLKDHATTMFEYVGETVNTIQGSTSDSTGMKMRAKIYIHPQRACRFSMQINNAELLVKSKNSETFVPAGESSKFARELEARNIVFQTAYGKIEKLFPHRGEPLHILNIKRGILSTLQLGETTTEEEVDVNGRCKVSVVEENGMFIKSKNLSECTERVHNELGVQTATFENDKMPINPLNSTSRCFVATKDEQIVEVQCLESHIFRPFSAGFKKPAGAITTIKQTMRFIGEKSGRVVMSFAVEPKEEGVSMAYEHDTETLKPDNSIVSRIDAIMTKLVSGKNIMGVRQDSAHEFTQLVTLLRKLDKKRMRPVMEKYFECDKSGMCKSSETDLKGVYRQYFLDALTYCGTATCVSTVRDIILKDELTGENVNLFLQGIALVGKPTKGMIRDVKDIAASKPSRQAYLTLGILMYRYCSANEEQCAYGKTNPVTHAELFLEDKLGHSCNEENLERVEEILMAIKAIGNAGRPSRAARTLLSCAKTANHQNITTAALEALRRMPCNDIVNTRLHDMLENENLDSEKRIQSYVALMRCPTKDSIKRIVAHLEREKSRQVVSFMSSHLKNVNESSDPRHKNTQEMLASVLKGRPLKEFNLSVARFSKAFEGSVYSKYLKSGASVDGHLIFHQDSYIPKRALINVTANILDIPVNVFEMAARVEGVETLIEDLFGKDGYFPDNSVVKIFDYTFTKEDRARLRNKRGHDSGSIQANIDDLHKKANKQRVQPSGSLSMKILGHEMKVFSYDDIFWAADKIDNMNVIDLLLKVARGGKKTFTKSILFLEMTHSVPTGLGLPIKLGLKGSSVGSLELNGKFDIRNMFWGPRSLEIKGYVRPSAVVEISGQMGVHSHYVDTGVFVNSSMFTSQMMKGSVVYKEGKMFKINLDAPEEPIEFFNISSTPFMFVNEEIKMIEGTPRRISPDFCLNSKMILGLGICTSMSLPVAFREYEAPYFPLSGPAHFGMKIVKADPKLTTYQMLVSMEKRDIEDGRELTGTFQFGTPGATYNRGFTGVVRYQETDKIRRLIVGEIKEKNSAKITVEYHNNTNRFEVNFINNLISKKIMRTRFIYFNDSADSWKSTGVLMSASYDWYNFEHVTDFTREENRYSLQSKTVYWPEKFVSAQIAYTPSDRDVMIKFEANQLNQTVQMNGRYIKTVDERGMNFTVKHLQSGRRSSLYMGWMNNEETKKIILNTTCAWGRYHEFSLGYYNGQLTRSVRFDANIAGKTGSVFVSYSNATYGMMSVDVGAKLQGNVVGVFGSYSKEFSRNDQRVCATVYYNDKQPAKTCVMMMNMGDARRLMWTVRVLKKTAAISFDYSKMEGTRLLVTTFVYNEKEKIKNIMSLTCKSLWEMEVKTTTKIGQKMVTGRVFSEVQANSDIAFGVEANGFKQMVKLQATYSRVASEVSTLYSVNVEAWVNKKLPVSYIASLTYGKPEVMVKSVLNVKEYKMISSMSWKRHESQRLSTRYFGILKRDFLIFGSDITDTLSLAESQKFFKTQWTITLANKSFIYGWDVEYKNRSTESKSAHAISFGLSYAQNRRSSVTFTLANSNRAVELIADVMYLPNRRVSHFISYDKEMRQLDVSVEFLPRMFVKLTGKLDKINGWRFTTDLKFSWSNYNRVLTWIASYVNRSEIQGLSFRFLAYNREFFIGSEYNNKTKTAIFTMSAFGRTFRVAGYWIKGRKLIGLRLFTESKQGNELIPREIIEAVVSYSNSKVAFELKTRTASYMKTVAILNKRAGFASFEVIALQKSLFKVEGEMKKSQYLILSRLFVLGKERFQIVGKYNKNDKAAFLTFDALKKHWNIMFAARWNPERKELYCSTELLGRVTGFRGRFDPSTYVASWFVFYQEHQVGWTAYYDATNKAAVYNVTLSPRLSAQVVLQVSNDNRITFTFQRKFGLKIVNEAVFGYELNRDASNLIFRWNKDTATAIRNMIVPVARQSLTNAAAFFKKFQTTSRKVSIEMARNITSKVLRFINEADKKFDDIDFAGLKNKAGEIVVQALKQAATLTNKGLKLTGKALTKVHEKLPEIMENARIYARKSVAVSKTGMEEARRIAKITYKIAKNLTESGIPVAKTAIKLAKEFRIRGKTMEEVVAQLSKMAENITKTWKENLSKQLIQLKKDFVKYVVEMPVPYRKERLGELVKIYINRIKEIRANFNLEEKTRQLTRELLEYKIQGKTVVTHYQEALKSMKNLPEEMKMTVFKYIRESRIYARKIKKTLRTVKSFFQPLVTCITRVHKSINKHFSPLLANASKEVNGLVRSEFTKIYTPTKDRITQLINMLERFIAPLLKPIRPLYNKMRDQMRVLRVAEVEIGTFLDSFLESYKMELESRLKKTSAKISSEIERVVKYVKSLSLMTPEKMTESVIDGSVVLGKDTVEYARAVYKNREEIIRRWKSNADKVIDDAKSFYAIITSKPVEDMIHIGFQMTGEKLIATMKEMVKIIDQLSVIEISKPLEQAWKDIDIFNHLEKYGVNSNILKVISAAKNVNLTETVFATIDAAKEKILNAYGVAESRYVKLYRSSEKVYRYIRSIPKKEWEDFYTEVESYLLKNKGELYEIVMKIVSSGKMRLMKTADEMKQTYARCLDSYGKPALRLYNLVKDRAMLVYSENKDDCSIVMNMYKEIIVGMLKERYEMVKSYYQNVYKKYHDQLLAFYNKHEGKTWEQIGENIYELGKEKYDVAFNQAEQRVEKLRVLAKKGYAIAKELYANATRISKKYIAIMKTKYETKILPEAVKIYSKAMMKYETALEYYNNYYNKMIEIYNEMYLQALEMYESNKKLSIRQLYKKGANTINSKVTEQMKKMNEQMIKLKAIAKNKYENVLAKAVEMKNRFNAEILPVVLEEAESILNQTLRASVILANETVKAYTPHCRIVKAYALDCYAICRKTADKYYSDAAEYFAKYYTITKERSMVMYKKGLVKATEQVQKIIKYLKEAMEKVKTHPRYQQIVKHDLTINAIKYFKQLLATLNEKIAALKVQINELKQHPQVLEYRQKFEQFKQKIIALKQNARVLRLLRVLKQIKQSLKFTAAKLTAKMLPHLETIRINAAKVPVYVKTHAVMFRKDPAECFWTNVANLKSVINMARTYNWKSIDVKQNMKDLVREVTNEQTKEAYENMKKTSLELYAKYYALAKSAPEMIKEKALKMYNEKMEILNAQISHIKAQWKRCPMYPIVNHEIWGEIAAEIKNHEIVTGVKSLAAQTRSMIAIYNVMLAEKINKYTTEKRAEIKAKIDDVLAKCNAFLDETTLEDIVNKCQETYSVAKTRINAETEKLVIKIKKAYGIAKERYDVYKAKAMVVGKKYYEKADKIWKEKYPQVVRRATAVYEKAMRKINKTIEDVVRYSKEMKVKIAAKTLKLWNESCCKKNLMILKGMTVGETVAEIKMLPLRAEKMYQEAVKMMNIKLEELKSKYDKHILPRVQKIERVIKAVVHEINATGIFIYKYYNLEGNMMKLRDFSAAKVRYGVSKVKSILPQIPGKIQMYAKMMAKKSLKSVHTSLVFLDNLDLKPYIERIVKMKEYIPDIKTYVVLNTKEGQVMFIIPHIKPVHPQFSYHIRKINNTLREKAAKISNETVAITKNMLAYIRNKTAEFREDLNTSFIAHSKFGCHLRNRVATLSAKVWSKSSDLKKSFYQTADVVNDYTRQTLTKGKQISTDAFNFANNAVVDITYSNGLEQAYEKAKTYSKITVQNIKKELMPVYEMTNKYGKELYKKLSLQYLRVMYKAKPYYLLVKAATKEWRNGAEFRTAFRVIEVQLKKAYRSMYETLKTKTAELKSSMFDLLEAEDLTMIDEYLKSHKTILGKYVRRAYRTYRFSRMRVMMNIRKAKKMIKSQWSRASRCPYTTTAMIFGKHHVMTFDKTFYDVPNFPKKQCTYLLAHDFESGNLTVMSQQERLIVKTPDIEVTVHKDGSVVSTLKTPSYKKIVTGLPVESKTSSCHRSRHSVHCNFEQGLALVCNVKHFVCTIELMPKLYGKTRGLLGTNNHEKYDDFKLPGGKITKSVIEFVNSWLVTRSGDCMIKDESNQAPSCSKAPSERCYEIFKNTSSPLAPLFKVMDPLPFLKACLVDTADCDTDEARSTSHCNSTKAYRMILRNQGFMAPKIDDCMTYTREDGKIVRRGEKWVQKMKKEVDIVFMISERRTARKMKRSIATMLYYVNKGLEKKGFDTRYALIGFGGNGVHEEPHYHVKRGRFFRNAAELTSIIKEMPYTGKSENANDAYGAIDYAAALQYRPGSKRVVFMINYDEPRSSLSLDVIMHELRVKVNASLFAFDNFNFKKYGNSDVTGLTAKRVYLSPDFQTVPIGDYKMPESPFTELARASNGGLFLNKFKYADMKVMVAAVSDALTEPVTQSKLSCQECKLENSVVRCRTNNRITC